MENSGIFFAAFCIYNPIHTYFRVPKRKRGRPKKNPRDSDEEFELRKKLNFDEWVINHIFKCAKCDESVQGFQPALDHMIEKHEIEKEGQNDDNLSKPSYPCILCSMTFGRRELVKKHLQGHIQDEENEEPETEVNTNLFLDFEDRYDSPKIF